MLISMSKISGSQPEGKIIFSSKLATKVNICETLIKFMCTCQKKQENGLKNAFLARFSLVVLTFFNFLHKIFTRNQLMNRIFLLKTVSAHTSLLKNGRRQMGMELIHVLMRLKNSTKKTNLKLLSAFFKLLGQNLTRNQPLYMIFFQETT